MLDRLTTLLNQFDLRARTYHNGPLCGSAHFDEEDGVAHLHLLREGQLTIIDADGSSVELSEPTVLLYPRPRVHSLRTKPGKSVELVCAAIEFGATENPVLRSLPHVLITPLKAAPNLQVTLELLFEEAFARRCGHPGVVDRLSEVLMVQLMRYAIEQRLADAGLMAGLADARLARVLTAVHAEPARSWTLESMADEANMSRSRFSAHFKEVLGTTPAEYVTRWRMSIAKRMLRRGDPVKQVAEKVGYSDASSFGRAFAQLESSSPKEWTGLARGPHSFRDDRVHEM